MKLVEFRVQNFRSVNDSGVVEVRDRTALVGRNESGKSNLLLALRSLNPPGGVKPLSDTKDFPRDRRITDFDEKTEVVSSKWTLTEEEQAELAEIYPRLKKAKFVTVGRTYSDRWVGFDGASSSLPIDKKTVAAAVGVLASSTDATLKNLSKALEAPTDDDEDWTSAVATAAKAARAGIDALSGTGKDAVTKAVEHAEAVALDSEQHSKARTWVGKRLPTFIYLHDYPELEGHQDIQELVNRKNQNQRRSSDEYFFKLLKVAGLDIDELHKHANSDAERRALLVNRAGAVVTKKLRELWTDRQLKVRFNLDGRFFDTLISDPNSLYDIEVNLDERSRGLRWFFAFYITFAADTEGGPAENAILLLDEPGLHLHAVAQENLLVHFEKDFKNQIIYSTHSPFMIPVRDLAAVRTVNIDTEKGTTVTNNPSGDTRTLFPLQAALGYDLTQTLFIGEKNLVVEGVTDYWYLSTISEHFKAAGKAGLPSDLVITPAGGASKVGYMVALLAAQRLQVLVLLDAEQQGRLTQKELLRDKLIRDSAVIMLNDGTSSTEADIEDLLDPAIFEALAREAYAKELKGKKLTLNDKIPRIVPRFEDAFAALSLEFQKSRIASLFMRRMGEKPESVTNEDMMKRFDALFAIITKRLASQTAAARAPFR